MRAVDLAIGGARASGFECRIVNVVDDDDHMKILRPAGPVIRPQSWATIARGVYRGDGCFVEDINEAGQAVVWCIPRLDLAAPICKMGNKKGGLQVEDAGEFDDHHT